MPGTQRGPECEADDNVWPVCNSVNILFRVEERGVTPMEMEVKLISGRHFSSSRLQRVFHATQPLTIVLLLLYFQALLPACELLRQCSVHFSCHHIHPKCSVTTYRNCFCSVTLWPFDKGKSAPFSELLFLVAHLLSAAPAVVTHLTLAISLVPCFEM